MRYLLLLTLLMASGANAQQRDTITFLHVNDSHSMLAPFGPRAQDLRGTRGGIARVASVVGMTRATEKNVMFVHNGDFMIGDLFFNKYFGVAELRLLQALGLDALNLSNHEFDLTPAVLSQALDSGFAAGEVPILTANLVIPQQGFESISKRVRPNMIRQFGSAKVGIFGMITPATNLLSQPAPLYVDTNIAAIVISQVQELKTKGCDAIIFMSGLGVDIDKQLASAIPGIDVIIGGDDHYLIDPAIEVTNPAGEKTYIVQANAFYSHVGKVRLEVANGKAKLLDYHAIPLDASIPEEPNTKAAVDMLVADIESVYGPMYSQQIGIVTNEFGEVPDDLTKAGSKDTPVGNLLTDIYRAAFSTDIAIQAGGSTAQVLHEGPIVPADLYRTISYGFNLDNTLGYHMATFDISGQALAMGLEFGVSNLLDDEFLSQTSGMNYTYDPTLPPMSRITSVMINGQPLDLSRTYSVTTNEFAPMILSAIGIPISNVRIYGGDTTEFGIVTAAVSKMQTLTPSSEGRIRAVASQSVNITSIPAMMKAFPNPCSSSTELRFDLRSAGEATLTMMDMTGKVVHTSTIHGITGLNTISIDAHEIPSGRYLCMMQTGTERRTTLLTVQH